jgi:hypothetical protein
LTGRLVPAYYHSSVPAPLVVTLGPVVHIEALLRAVLSRRYEVPPTGNSKTSLLTPETISRIHDLHDEGKGPVEIGRVLGISRKQVARVVAELKAAEEKPAKPSPCPKQHSAE